MKRLTSPHSSKLSFLKVATAVLLSSASSQGALIQLTPANLNNPTQAQLLAGITVNDFARNVSTPNATYQVRERTQLQVTGGTITSVASNGRLSGETGTLQISGVGGTVASIAMPLPAQNVNTQDASTGFNMAAAGSSITAATYTYDLPTVFRPGDFPAPIATNQPFSIEINVEQVIPEPSTCL